MKFKIPYPPSELMPNRKNGKHWGATSSIKSKARDDAFLLTLEHRKECLVMRLDDKGHYALRLTYFQTDKRHRDLDNLLAASKAHIDGIAGALKIDDKQFQPITINRAYADEAYTLVEIT
jgi:crossover junction endodeoxyribonuclease RusA